MRFTTNIEVYCDHSAKLEEALRGDIGSHEKSKTSLMARKGSLRISIESTDITSLRASFNSITKLISVHQDMEKTR